MQCMKRSFFSVLKIRHARARTNTIASQNKHICTIGEPERELDLVEFHGRVPFSFNCTTTTTTQSRLKKTVSLMWRSLENVCAPVCCIIGTQDTLYCIYIFIYFFGSHSFFKWIWFGGAAIAVELLLSLCFEFACGSPLLLRHTHSTFFVRSIMHH